MLPDNSEALVGSGSWKCSPSLSDTGLWVRHTNLKIGQVADDAKARSSLCSDMLFDKETQAECRCIVMPGLDITNTLFSNASLYKGNPNVHLVSHRVDPLWFMF